MLKRKNKFTSAEDRLILKMIKKCGKNIDWRKISLVLENKSPRQCRERYNFHLKSELKKGEWTKEEDDIILKKYEELGPKWKTISSFVPGRTSDNTRNRILCLKKKISKNSDKNIENSTNVVTKDDDTVNFLFNDFEDIFQQTFETNIINNL